MAPGSQRFFEKHADDGYTAITVLPGKVSTDDLAAWTDAFGITHPVLADTNNDVKRAWSLGSGRPQVLVLDRDQELAFNDTGGSAREDAEDVILDLLAR